MKPCAICGREHLNDDVLCWDCYHAAGGRSPYYYIGIMNDDPFRKAWLGDAEQKAAEQGRMLDPEAPKDKFEAKERHERLGRVYIGDDYGKLSDKAVKAIEHGKGLGD